MRVCCRPRESSTRQSLTPSVGSVAPPIQERPIGLISADLTLRDSLGLLWVTAMANEYQTLFRLAESGQQTSLPADRNWARLLVAPELSSLSIVQKRKLWETVFREWDSSEHGPAPMWLPTEANMEAANLTKLTRKISLHSRNGGINARRNSGRRSWIGCRSNFRPLRAPSCKATTFGSPLGCRAAY